VLIDYFIPFLPALGGSAASALVLWGANRFLMRNKEGLGAEAKLPRQLLLLLFTGIASLFVLLLIPMSETTRGQVLRLVGLVITGVIAFSSTTFVANAMAGLMLRIVRSFRGGDFICIGEQFGRVSERGLFHTEIQTEDRDLTTLPNLYLVSNSVTVIRSSGTIISATVSIGYDFSHTIIEELLSEAATQTGLQEPFVQIKDLHDYSVSYRVAGFLPEIKQLLTVRSNLKKNILDVLHSNNIEIASPALMIQRRQEEGKKIVPATTTIISPPTQIDDSPPPEEKIFDKAEGAAQVESLNDEHAHLVKTLAALKELKGSLNDEGEQKNEIEIVSTQEQIERLSMQIEAERAKTVERKS
jgi:hypothetical protein